MREKIQLPVAWLEEWKVEQACEMKGLAFSEYVKTKT